MIQTSAEETGGHIPLQRFVILTTCLITFCLVLAGCGLFAGEGNDDDVETPVPTATVEASDDASPEPDSDEEVDPDANPDDVVIVPDDLRLVSAAGAQSGKPRSYFWVHRNQMVALEIEGHFVPLQDEPLEVESGEVLEFDPEFDDEFPYEMSIRVFPREGNFEGTVATREGMKDAFYPHTEPILSEEIEPDDRSWQADLEAGEYFILLETHWETPEGSPKDVWAEYAYWLIVS